MPTVETVRQMVSCHSTSPRHADRDRSTTFERTNYRRDAEVMWTYRQSHLKLLLLPRHIRQDCHPSIRHPHLLEASSLANLVNMLSDRL